jgi:hypothetical protein
MLMVFRKTSEELISAGMDQGKLFPDGSVFMSSASYCRDGMRALLNHIWEVVVCND